MSKLRNRFAPKNKQEEIDFAVESLLNEVQSEIYDLMIKNEFTKTRLAEEVGVSKARITHLLGDKAQNVTVATIARVFHALGERARFSKDGCLPRKRKHFDVLTHERMACNQNDAWLEMNSERGLEQNTQRNSVPENVFNFPVDRALPKAKWNSNPTYKAS